jgi:hypothetical protein
MNGMFEATGGARVGWANATWPLAKLTATPDSLRVTILLLGDYSFTPGTVVSITRFTIIPVLGWGIQIQHCVHEYPQRFIFWCLGNPDILLSGIRESGFLPKAPKSALPPRRGLAVRWQAIAIVIVAWNGLFLLDMSLRGKAFPVPGPFALLAIALAFAAAIATIRVPAFGRLVIKPDRSVREIRPFLNLLIFITGVMFVMLSFVVAFVR